MSDIMLDEQPWINLFQPSVPYGLAKAAQWKPHPNYIMIDFRRQHLLSLG
jgi:hypothetical protein